jgi:siroheme synthase (precorrin-2 oxidase/ferrochelatase)
MSKRVLIVGCGQLGSRHLQAVALVEDVCYIAVVDPNPDSLLLGKQRFKEMKDISSDIILEWFQQLPVGESFDLCVVATLAPGRRILITQIIEKVNVKRLLVEKIVVQSIEDYQWLVEMCQQQGVKIWVNCKTRAYQVHQYIKSKIGGQGPFNMTVIAGNQGLATNGIHEIDIFFYYCPSSVPQQLITRINPVLVPSKRGKNIYDLSGMIAMVDDHGNSFSMDFQYESLMPDIINITTPQYRFVIDHYKKLCLESSKDNDWQWQFVPVDESWQVSVMTKQFASDILTQGNCLLPTLAEHQPAHELMIRSLKPEFIKLGVCDGFNCPVT